MEQTATSAAQWDHLLDIKRDNVTERSIFGAVAIRAPLKSTKPFPRADLKADPLIFGRSLMKPYQMKALTSVLAESLSWEEKALSLASHNGDATQVRVAQNMLKPEDWNALLLPASLPLRPRPDATIKDRWLNPCSGKHAAIVRACDRLGWPRQDYTSRAHPYFAAYKGELERRLNQKLENRETAPDGCLLPTLVLSVSEMAVLFAELAVEKDQDWIWEAHHRHPELIGGEGRFDSLLLKTQQSLLAKEGADGLLGLSLSQPQPLGIVIKLAHGYDPAVTWHIARLLLGDLIPPAPEFGGQHVVFSKALQTLADSLRNYPN